MEPSSKEAALFPESIRMPNRNMRPAAGIVVLAEIMIELLPKIIGALDIVQIPRPAVTRRVVLFQVVFNPVRRASLSGLVRTTLARRPVMRSVSITKVRTPSGKSDVRVMQTTSICGR